MNLVLYGFKICPFVERTNILLNEKNIKCERVHVDIRKKPDWFLKLSPLGKVPILCVNKTILFESTVINEFLDEISTYPSLHPDDPLLKASNRSWIEWGSILVFDVYYMTLARDKLEFNIKQNMINSKLSLLEQELCDTPFFNGEKFSMVDLAYAPLFRRFESLYRTFSIDILEQYPKLKSWANFILKKISVQNGFALNFDEEFYQLLKLKGSSLIKSEK